MSKKLAMKRSLPTVLLIISLVRVLAICRADQPPEPPADINQVSLSEDDLRFGREQVDQMVRDRPPMAAYLQGGDVIYEWAVRQMAGGAVRQHVHWSAKGPGIGGGYLAFHQDPMYDQVGKIFVRERYELGPLAGQQLSGEIMWSAFIFELFNISHAAEFNDVEKAAMAGTVTRQEYIEKKTRGEFAALTATARFYRKTWRPYLESKGLETHGESWHANDPADYKDWISAFTDPKGYPALFGLYYDEIRRHDNASKAARPEGIPEHAVEKDEASKTWF